ncbi:putative malate dehydrogenase 1B [Lampris incognitus]|uniref:putative malate dehydrogenase 1B n=1 Tax=Lampris incognitus TaxID=2546036 RepID=UPI0024B5A6C1|nr:putative malate dehydrogenase 1B [Lampris incognitus]
MAKFVIAGKADCPYYAKAELLGDHLQGSLPDFRIKKISIHPDEWKGWLEDACKTNGWKHKQSPLIWRELTDIGSKKMLLGGCSDLLEHCQDYYGITSDMLTDMMLKIATENLETNVDLTKEEQHHASLIQPLHIWIGSALNPTCHSLIPCLLSPETFPHITAISLHLLDLEGDKEAMHGLRMETEDLAVPLLHEVTVHTDLERAFQDAHVVILLDDSWPRGGDRENEEVEEKRQLMRVSARYQNYGRLIDKRANKEVMVIVAGDLFVNLRCSLLMVNAPSINCCRFVATATQLEYEARACIAKKLRVRTTDIKDVIVWGNISGSFFIDLQRAKVFNYNGAIKGPTFFSQPVLEMLYDRKWLKTDFQDLVRCHRKTMASKTGRAATVSGTNGILTVLKAWSGISCPDEVLSLGVLCRGQYGLPDGTVFSVPVTFKDGEWSVLLDLTVGEELRERLQLSSVELEQEKDLASELTAA